MLRLVSTSPPPPRPPALMAITPVMGGRTYEWKDGAFIAINHPEDRKTWAELEHHLHPHHRTGLARQNSA